MKLERKFWCKNCEEYVMAERSINLGTLILVFVTYGLWFPFILFYPKRCPYCGKVLFK